MLLLVVCCKLISLRQKAEMLPVGITCSLQPSCFSRGAGDANPDTACSAQGSQAPGCKTLRVNAGTPRSTGAGLSPRGDLDWPDLTSPTLSWSYTVWFDAYPRRC